MERRSEPNWVIYDRRQHLTDFERWEIEVAETSWTLSRTDEKLSIFDEFN